MLAIFALIGSKGQRTKIDESRNRLFAHLYEFVMKLRINLGLIQCLLEKTKNFVLTTDKKLGRQKDNDVQSAILCNGISRAMYYNFLEHREKPGVKSIQRTILCNGIIM